MLVDYKISYLKDDLSGTLFALIRFFQGSMEAGFSDSTITRYVRLKLIKEEKVKFKGTTDELKKFLNVKLATDKSFSAIGLPITEQVPSADDLAIYAKNL